MIKTPLTDVDRSTYFTLCFPELGAQAQLSCNINVPSNGLSATLRFRNGNILIPEPLYCPKSCSCSTLRGQVVARCIVRRPHILTFPDTVRTSKQTKLPIECSMGSWKAQFWDVIRHYWRWKYLTRGMLMRVITPAILTVTNRVAARVGIGSLKKLYMSEGNSLKWSICVPKNLI